MMVDVEILITAKIRDCGEENKALLREDLKEELEKCMKDFAGESNNRKGMYFFLEDVEHEIAFQDEGKYEFVESPKPICVMCSKNGTPECKKSRYTIYKGIMVACSGFESDTHDE